LARPADLATATGKEIAVTKQKLEDAWTLHTSTDDVPLKDLGVQIVLRETRRRVNLRKAIEVSAKGGKKPSPHVLATMVKHLRAHYAGHDYVLDFVINAFDPATQSDWKLEPKRRKGRHPNVDNLHLFSEYSDFRKAYESQGKKQAHKRAVTDLAKKYGRGFDAMEAAIRRGRKMMDR
jgi:hypothetical protein